jgi:hypothetical protein
VSTWRSGLDRAGLRHAVVDVDVLVGLSSVLDPAERLGMGREGQRQQAEDDERKDLT